VGQAQRLYEPLAAWPAIDDRTQVAACVHALVVWISHIEILYQYEKSQQKIGSGSKVEMNPFTLPVQRHIG